MKKLFFKKSHIFTLLLLMVVLWKQVPILLHNLQSESLPLPSKSYPIISSQSEPGTVEFPPKDSRAITVFWATWCGPCKIEMERLQKSVEKGKIPRALIFAINPFERASVSKKFISEHNYPFTFIDAPEVTEALKVEVTPTTVLTDKEQISSMSSGMSLIGIWRAEMFLTEVEDETRPQ